MSAMRKLGAAVAVMMLAAPAGVMGQAAQAAPKLGDAEIAAIVVAANAVDAEMGEVAIARANRADVKQFGQTMVTDHRAVNKSAGELVAKLGVTPVENDVSRKLRADGAAMKKSLMEKSGAAFDVAYITHEVAYHKAVIAAVDSVLIPNAANAELKATLVSVRPALVAHLAHAEKLLAGLK